MKHISRRNKVGLKRAWYTWKFLMIPLIQRKISELEDDVGEYSINNIRINTIIPPSREIELGQGLKMNWLTGVVKQNHPIYFFLIDGFFFVEPTRPPYDVGGQIVVGWQVGFSPIPPIISFFLPSPTHSFKKIYFFFLLSFFPQSHPIILFFFTPSPPLNQTHTYIHPYTHTTQIYI